MENDVDQSFLKLCFIKYRFAGLKQCCIQTKQNKTKQKAYSGQINLGSKSVPGFPHAEIFRALNMLMYIGAPRWWRDGGWESSISQTEASQQLQGLV